jgi:glycosyltransferase involved in cell wall biosynthesis
LELIDRQNEETACSPLDVRPLCDRVINGKYIVAALPAYNSEHTLEATVREIPGSIYKVILADDRGSDKTVAVARRQGLIVAVRASNHGYGRDPKTCYKLALKNGADAAVTIHSDYRHSPLLVAATANMAPYGVYGLMLEPGTPGGGALRGRMPFRALTIFQNFCLGASLSEHHTGYRAFTREIPQALPLSNNSEDLVAENQVLAQALFLGVGLGEMWWLARYCEKASYIKYRRSIDYEFDVIETAGNSA